MNNGPTEAGDNERVVYPQHVIAGQLSSMAVIGSENATLATMTALAGALGLKNLNGLSLLEYYQRSKAQFIEYQISDVADRDPLAATALKELWESLR